VRWSGGESGNEEAAIERVKQPSARSPSLGVPLGPHGLARICHATSRLPLSMQHHHQGLL